MAIRLEKASFKEVGFLWRGGSIQEGQKTVTHEYPNTPRRFVEDLGFQQSRITMNGLITGNDGSYKQKRDALRKALSEGGEGVLVHPLYGTLICKALIYSLTENSISLGECNFNMVFLVTQQPVYPQDTGNSFTKLANKIDLANLSIVNSIKDGFALIAKGRDNLVAAMDQVQAIGDDFNSAISAVTQPIDDFQAELRQFQDSVGVIAQSPDLLAASVTSLISNFQTVGGTPGTSASINALAQFKLNTDFYDFGDDTEVLTYDTAASAERENNERILNLAMQTGFLNQSYLLLTSIEFENENTLDEISQALEVQFDKVADNIDPAVLVAMDEVRAIATQIISEAQVIVFKITTVNVKPAPIGVIAYRYYGSQDQEDGLIELNTVRDPSRVKGDIQVFTK